uniref:Uncharacterized protein n=1 Tax=Arundo donax TaxID=35708 RepID=A0A0A9DK47_ARUDO
MRFFSLLSCGVNSLPAYHQGSPCTFTLSVQILRHCRCKEQCSESQLELRTTACTIDSKHSPQYQDQTTVWRSGFHCSSKGKSIECIPSIDKDFSSVEFR